MTNDLLSAADDATRIAAPLWPLKHFVAVNPYLGMTGQGFDAAAGAMAAYAGARSTLPRAFYAEALAEGRVTEADLAEAIARAGAEGVRPADLRALAGTADAAPEALPTVAELAGRGTGTDWPALVTERISAFAAAHYDEGQALWPAAGKGADGAGLYAAWRREAALDRTPEIAGLAGARAAFAALPETAEETIALAARTLGLEGAAWTHYCRRLVLSMPGWSGAVRYRLWQAELHGGTTPEAREMLAIRLGWEMALLPRAEGAAWAAARRALARGPAPAAEGDLLLQAAFELAWQRGLVETFAAPGPAAAPAEAAPERPKLQAAFCIDVRSEVFRRALETVEPGAETIGFAGFFGAAISYTPLARAAAGDQCPVLLTPGYRVRETAPGGAAEGRRAALMTGTAWSAFKQAAVSSFAYVETVGLGFGARLAAQALGLAGSAVNVRAAGLSTQEAESLAPELAPAEDGSGIPQEDRPGLAEFMLAGMGLTGPLARVVLLAGHGATSANNPHATGLDCGACGGHTGEANARVAAAVLNDPGVRRALAEKGRALPEDTIFVPGLHNTTTDEVTLYDTGPFEASHGDDLARLREVLARAGALTRAERAALLNLSEGADPEAAVPARAEDWSQVRPEWGLAGCAAFIAAPRGRSRGRDLGGRAFLHSYAWQQDEGFGVLELIMTAPLVVASWINLQYYGSTVDNAVLGAGNKVLHNAAGASLGVLEGNAGDLRPGLPWQSVHDGARYIHEPLRLNAVIEAPEAAMTGIIGKHPGLAELLDNGWVHLFRMDESGRIVARYAGRGVWVPVGAGAGLAEAA